MNSKPRANAYGLALPWNLAVEQVEERKAEPRDYLWASELGKSNIDLLLKMKGVEPSNPFNVRSRRKMDAGNVFEWLVQVVLIRCGILRSTQERVNFQYPGLLRVSGKMDFLAGGMPDHSKWERWGEMMREMMMPEFFFQKTQYIREYMQENYPEGLAEVVLEIKSVGDLRFRSLERKGKASVENRLQAFHYLKGANRPFGTVTYINREDMELFEVFLVNPNPEDEALYRKKIEEMTGYYNAFKDVPVDKFILPGEEGTRVFVHMEGMPPLEKQIVWDADYGRFVRNWNIGYSSYLTMLYGYESTLEYEETVAPITGTWNRAMKRLRLNKKRNEWLASNGKSESDVQKELVAVEGKKNRQAFFFIMVGDQKIPVPDELKSGWEIKPETEATLNDIRAAGHDPEALVAEFAEDKDEEEV